MRRILTMKAFNARTVSDRTCHIIRDERLSRELTQIEMASQLGISQSALSKIENLAMMPTLIPWLKFCAAFDLPANLPLDEKLYKNWSKDLDKKPVRGGAQKNKSSKAHLNS